jgi:large subunit ribosomal protein L4
MAHSLKGDRSVKSLSRKAKKLGMIHALSSKMKDKNIILIDDLKAKEAKTSKIKKHLENLSIKSAFIVEGEVVDSNFALSIRNLKDVKFTASEGINVYDIIKYEKLVLSKNALSSIEKKVLSQ